MLTKLIAPFLQNKLTKQQKHATAVLSIGTFLEYFDLYLYIHMSFLMDQIFFPPGSSNNWFLSKLALCTNFIFRPVGAIILGWLGDNFGRKSTIFISTTATSACCLVTYYLPTYEQIGIMAAYILTGCRIVQSMLSSAEVQGARVYLMETSETTTKQCFLSSLVNCFTNFGRFAAVVIANIFIHMGGNSWRTAYLVGAIVALLGAYARSSLKETPEFADAKRRLNNSAAELNSNLRSSHPLLKDKLDKKDAFYLFILKCGEALGVYYIYSYCAQALRNLGLPNDECINYATYASTANIIRGIVFMLLIFYFNPLKIIKFTTHGAPIFFILVPLLLQNFTSPSVIFFSQIALLIFIISDYPASPIIYKRFPVLQRFTSVLMISALSRAITWPVCAYGISFLTQKHLFGHYGLYAIFLPMSVLSIMAVRHFIKANKKTEYVEQQSEIKASIQNI
jgi:MHS family proline/betaine transporter-like MFS transporter